jgi:hypothetical protein
MQLWHVTFATDDKSGYRVKLSEIFAVGYYFFQAVVCSWELSYQSNNLEKACRSHALLLVSHFCGPDFTVKGNSLLCRENSY